MPPREHILRVVREWTDKAESDLKAGDCLLSADPEDFAAAICFHAQQCAEKYLKALLVLGNMPVPKTHDIERILALLPPLPDLSLTTEQARLLTSYAADIRYPGAEAISPPAVREAMRVARMVRDGVRALLPCCSGSGGDG